MADIIVNKITPARVTINTKTSGSTGSVQWGQIIGTLSDQADLQTTFTTQQTALEEVNNKVATIASSVTAHTDNINTNKENIATNTKNITANTQNIATNTKNIAANTKNITSNTKSISSIKTLTSSINSTAQEAYSAMNFSQVRLNIIDRRLYIVAPKGLLNVDTDKPVFARYVKSNIRYWVNSRYYHSKRRGWIRPQKAAPNAIKYDYVPMRMELDEKRWGSDVFDYFYILSAAQNYNKDTTLPDDYYTEDVAKDLHTQQAIDYNRRKLGVCIERDGKQITDYLPFTIQDDYLTRWAIGIKVQ